MGGPDQWSHQGGGGVLEALPPWEFYMLKVCWCGFVKDSCVVSTKISPFVIEMLVFLITSAFV